MAIDIEHLLRRWDRLQADRAVWNQHYDDLAAVLLPRRIGFAAEAQPGARLTEGIFDGTPMIARRGLANAVTDMLHPNGQQWVFLKCEDDGLDNLQEVKDWLYSAEQKLIRAVYNPKARFTQMDGEVADDLVTFGTGPCFIGEARGGRHLSYRSLHLKDVWIALGEDGVADTLFLRERLTARQAAQRFGEERLGRVARELLANDRADERVVYLQIVAPRRGGAKGPFALAWDSAWIEVDSRARVRVDTAGFHEFPFAVPRWDTSSGEDYGRSPGMVALPDSNTLQAMGETVLIAGQRAADPPILVPNDGAIRPDSFPGGLFAYDAEIAREMGRIPIEPMHVGTNLPITRDMQMDTREQVRAAFYKNVLNLPVDGPSMTATEITERKKEFLREIGAPLGRLETDYTAPVVERSFAILLRHGAFDPIPQVLRGRAVRFEYESPVKVARQLIEIAAVHQWVAEQIQIAAETGNPAHLDNVDLDEYARFTGEAASIPPKLRRDPKLVAALRSQRAQAAQAAAQAEAAARIADAAPKATAALSELSAMMQRKDQAAA